jgi:hypothetical protein
MGGGNDMTRQWIEDNFKFNNDGYVMIYNGENSDLACDENFLSDLIISCETYEDLCKLEVASQGWQKIFDQWRERQFV